MIREWRVFEFKFADLNYRNILKKFMRQTV